MQVLGGLHAGRERFAVQVLVHPRAEEADQRARLGGGDVPERTPRREHAAGGRVTQVHQVGQMSLFVQLDGGGDLDHLQERDGALLHARSARARRRQQRQALGCGFRHRGGDPLGCGHPDGSGEEIEFADDDGHTAAEDRAFAGQHGFVEPGQGLRFCQFALVILGTGDLQRRGVPAAERALVEHCITKRAGADPTHGVSLYRLAT